MHSWTSAHLKPWTAQDDITPCSSHSCLTDPNLLYCGKDPRKWCPVFHSGCPKNHDFEPLDSFFLRPSRIWWKTNCKNEERLEKYACSPGNKHIFVKPCPKQHAFLVDPLGVSKDFLYTPSLMFFVRPPSREAQTKKGGVEIEVPRRSRIKISIPGTSQRCPFRPKRGAKREGHSVF